MFICKLTTSFSQQHQHHSCLFSCPRVQLLQPTAQPIVRPQFIHADGVIEKSNASYYSHPVIVQKTEDKVRVCIDYRNLNDRIKPASWPLPNIRGLFERTGHNKPTVFANGQRYARYDARRCPSGSIHILYNYSSVFSPDTPTHPTGTQ